MIRRQAIYIRITALQIISLKWDLIFTINHFTLKGNRVYILVNVGHTADCEESEHLKHTHMRLHRPCIYTYMSPDWSRIYTHKWTYTSSIYIHKYRLITLTNGSYLNFSLYELKTVNHICLTTQIVPVLKSSQLIAIDLSHIIFKNTVCTYDTI